MNLNDLQHFKYVGGGYFRDSRVVKGKNAPVLHGGEIIEIIHNHLNKPLDPSHHSLPGNDETTCNCEGCQSLCQ